MLDMMNGGQGGWIMGSGMWPFSILFWILIIAGVVFITRWLMEGKAATGINESPLDILKRRYANGEIDRDSFEQMKRDIEG
jgi:putative membrane protein